jgi:hypothetical protein
MIGLPLVPIVWTEMWSICWMAGAGDGAIGGTGGAAKAGSGDAKSRAAAARRRLRVEKVMILGFP